MKIHGLAANLCGPVALAGDKSMSHRALLHAALSPARSTLRNVLRAGVTEAMIGCLQRLGVAIEQAGAELHVQGGAWRPVPDALHCGNSGTTLRLMLGAIASQPLRATLSGTPGLQRRPMQRLADPLRLMGAQIDNNFAPLTVSGGALHGIEYAIPVASAQLKAALLLAALHASGPTTLHEPGPSRDHSERMLRALGVDVRSHENVVTLYPLSVALPAAQLTLPADMSAAAFMLAVAVLVPGSSIQMQGVGVNPTRTGFLESLQEMGADIRITNQREEGGEPVADLEAHHSALRAVEIGGARVVRMIDEFPIFAVLATQATGRTLVRDAAELRLKESDRITALAGEMRKLGVVLTEHADGFELRGPQAIQPAAVASHGDHRLAMSLAIAGLLAPGTTTVDGADAVDESFPGFGAALQQLGAAVEVDPA